MVQIHHQLRVATAHHREANRTRANICLDVAVIRATEIAGLSTNDHVPNSRVVTFGEAKHMSAFAELVASFIGMVHEMSPAHVKSRRTKQELPPAHLPPFLYVSGQLYGTAQGIVETIERRRLPIRVFTCTADLTTAFKLHDGDFTTEELKAKLKADSRRRVTAAKARIAARRAADARDAALEKDIPF